MHRWAFHLFNEINFKKILKKYFFFILYIVVDIDIESIIMYRYYIHVLLSVVVRNTSLLKKRYLCFYFYSMFLSCEQINFSSFAQCCNVHNTVKG